ncbi:ABC transporter ATP-binding protein/permease [Pelagibius litoralis]|uniref:ABC transporter ATP-binding protein/permease n=1 Tax=Pelagibius litoralis TaxID=374515 RepID=A0A967F439_9PROT|nr:ABC transporter ATP-binding protein/permease [Pelagibius litoralis]NIA72471.1 ABC transporter ATP-binding protein/permease [Pelagibius litoralis]
MRPTTIEAGQKASFGQVKVLTNLLPYLWPQGRSDLKARVVAAMVLLVCAKVATVTIPLVLREAVDALTAVGDLILVLPLSLLLAYGVMRVAALAFGELRDGLFARVAQNAVRRVALATFRHVHALSLRFHLERQTGGLSRAIDRGTKGIEFLLFFTAFSVIPTLIEVLLACGILWYLFDWRFAVIPFVSIFAFVVFTFKVTEWRIEIRKRMNDADNDANTKAIDSLLNFETVKYFGNEGHEAERYDGALKVYEEASIKSRTSLSILNVGQSVIIAIGITLLMILAGMGVVAGTMTVGDFVMVNAYLLQLAMPLNFLGTVYREIKQSLIDLETMFKLLTSDAEVTDKPDAPALALDGGAVTFENVSFGYDPRRPILKDVSFSVKAGDTVAIVGPSGAGKSTISRILFRFYDVLEGSVKIDGQDIRAVTQDSLRGAIGIVPQDTVLFNDTVGYNVHYGRPGASEAEMVEAARLARIHDFVEGLPDGYATTVGERGLKLSGGEKQRVAIARTILKRPEILLFDEATSALDTKTEREIQASLREVSRDRTTLVIAHRLSTVVEADEILVLEQGRIVERGRHESLLSQKGVYAQMWARQQAASSDDEAEPATADNAAE